MSASDLSPETGEARIIACGGQPSDADRIAVSAYASVLALQGALRRAYPDGVFRFAARTWGEENPQLRAKCAVNIDDLITALLAAVPRLGARDDDLADEESARATARQFRHAAASGAREGVREACKLGCFVLHETGWCADCGSAGPLPPVRAATETEGEG